MKQLYSMALVSFLITSSGIEAATTRCKGSNYCFLVDGYDDQLDYLVTKGEPIVQDTGYDKPILFFDGECGFCDWSVRFIVARDINKTFYYTSLQGTTAQKLLPAELLIKPYKSAVLYDHGKMYIKSDAILRVLRDLKAPWSWLYIFRAMPQSMRDSMYQILSNNRHHIFGLKNECVLMAPEDAQRFLP